MVNCYMAREARGIRESVKAFTADELDLLAGREHERCNAERLQKVWRQGSQETSLKKQSFLKPRRDCDQKWKDMNRAMVECIPDILTLPSIGYQISRLGTGGK
jgi:hypothetical protein